MTTKPFVRWVLGTEWGKQRGTPYTPRPLSEIRGVMWHHSTGVYGRGRDPLAWMRQLDELSRRPKDQGGRGMSDFLYHVAIAHDPSRPSAALLLEGRPPNRRGAHCDAPLHGFDVTANTTHLGAVFLMDGTQESPTPAMLAAARAYLYVANVLVHPPVALVRHLHCEAKPTACPGGQLIAALRTAKLR